MRKKKEWLFPLTATRFVDNRKLCIYIFFLFLQVTDCERDIRATTSGNLRRQRAQERVCICFTNGLSTARARRAAINANVILWHDQLIFRCCEQHRETMSSVRKTTRAHWFVPHWQFLFAPFDEVVGKKRPVTSPLYRFFILLSIIVLLALYRRF